MTTGEKEDTPTIRPDVDVARPIPNPETPPETPNGDGIVNTQSATSVDTFRPASSEVAAAGDAVNALLQAPTTTRAEKLRDIPKVDSSLGGRIKSNRDVSMRLSAPPPVSPVLVAGNSKILTAAYRQSATLADISNFQRGPVLRYMRKSLTLGYQGALVAKDQLTLLQSIGEMLEQKLEAIKLNTGAPDIRKQTIIGALKASLFKYGVGRITETVGEKIEGVVSPYLKKGKEAAGAAWQDYIQSDRVSAEALRRGRDKAQSVISGIRDKLPGGKSIADVIADTADAAVNKTINFRNKINSEHPEVGETLKKARDTAAGAARNLYDNRSDYVTKLMNVGEQIQTKKGRASLFDQAGRTFHASTSNVEAVLENLKTLEGRARLKSWATEQTEKYRSKATGATESAREALNRIAPRNDKADGEPKLTRQNYALLSDLLENIDTVDGRTKLRQKFRKLKPVAENRLSDLRGEAYNYISEKADALLRKEDGVPQPANYYDTIPITIQSLKDLGLEHIDGLKNIPHLTSLGHTVGGTRVLPISDTKEPYHTTYTAGQTDPIYASAGVGELHDLAYPTGSLRKASLDEILGISPSDDDISRTTASNNLRGKPSAVRDQVKPTSIADTITHAVNTNRSGFDTKITRKRAADALADYREEQFNTHYRSSPETTTSQIPSPPPYDITEVGSKLDIIRERIDHWGDTHQGLLEQQLAALASAGKGSSENQALPNLDGTPRKQGFVSWTKSLPGRAAAGLYGATKFMAKGYMNTGFALLKTPYYAAKAAAGLVTGRTVRPFVDVYRSDNPKEPLVTKAQFEQGLVFDDGRPVINISKITKPVIDPTTHEVVISQEAIDSGLTDKRGNVLSKQGRSGIGGMLASSVATGVKGGAKLIGGIGGPLINLYGGLLKTGIKGAVGLGKVAGGVATAGLKAVPSIAGLGTSVLSTVAAPILSLYASALKGAGGLAVSGVKGLFNTIAGRSGGTGDLTKKDVKTLVADRLDDIYDLLVEHFAQSKPTVTGDADGDGIRDNSYADRVRKMAEKRKERIDKTVTGNNGNNLGLGRLGNAAIAAIMTGGRRILGGESTNTGPGDDNGNLTTAAGAAAAGAAASRFGTIKNVAKKVMTGGGRAGTIARIGAAGLAAYEGMKLFGSSDTKTEPSKQNQNTHAQTPQQSPIPSAPNTPVKVPTSQQPRAAATAPQSIESTVDAANAALVGTGVASAAHLGVSAISSKSAAKEAASTAGKAAAKKLPLIGIGVGGMFAYDRLAGGDVIGAGGELVSGLVAVVPGFGTAASLAIDAWLGYRDYTKSNDPRAKLTMARLTSYGVDSVLYDYTLALEKMQYDNFLSKKKLSPGEFTAIAGKFGFDIRNKNAVEYFASWYINRFSRLLMVYNDCLRKENLTYKTADSMSEDQASRILTDYQHQTSDYVTKYKRLVPTMIAYQEMVNSKGDPQTKSQTAAARDPAYDPVSGTSRTSATSGGATSSVVVAANNDAAKDAKNDSTASTSGGTPSTQQGQESTQPPAQNTPRRPLQLIGMSSTASAPATAAAITSGAVVTAIPTSSAIGGTTPSGNGIGNIPKPPTGTASNDNYNAANTHHAQTSDYLGSISEKYEAGKRGSAAIGWDRTGGTSYGKYQLAGIQGSADEFVKFLRKKGGDAVVIADRLEKAGPAETGSTKGGRPDEWRKIAAEGGFKNYEYEFIKEKFYDPNIRKLKPEVRDLVEKNLALQKVFWSTAVQHGSYARGIFEKTHTPGQSIDAYINKIYDERGTRFGKSEPHVQRSVLNRFATERNDAIAILRSSGSPAPVDPTKQAAAQPSTTPPSIGGGAANPATAPDPGGSVSTVSGTQSDTGGKTNEQAGGTTTIVRTTAEAAPSISPAQPVASGSPLSTQQATGGSGNEATNQTASTASTDNTSSSTSTTSPPDVSSAPTGSPFKGQAQGTTPSARSPITNVQPPLMSTTVQGHAVNQHQGTDLDPVVKAIIAAGDKQLQSQETMQGLLRALTATLTTSLGEGGTVVSALERPNMMMAPVVNQTTAAAPDNDASSLDVGRKVSGRHRG